MTRDIKVPFILGPYWRVAVEALVFIRSGVCVRGGDANQITPERRMNVQQEWSGAPRGRLLIVFRSEEER
jgi:hypothetical protein